MLTYIYTQGLRLRGGNEDCYENNHSMCSLGHDSSQILLKDKSNDITFTATYSTLHWSSNQTWCDIFSWWSNSHVWVWDASFSRFRDYRQKHRTWHDFSGRWIGPSQRPLPDNTCYSQETNIHTTGGIRTRSPRKRAAIDLYFRPLGHWCRSCLTKF